MSEELILQKLSARFKLLGSTPHLRICHRLAVEGPLSARQLGPRAQRALDALLREDLVLVDGDGCYRANLSVLRDLSEFVQPTRRETFLEYPRPQCCWPHSA